MAEGIITGSGATSKPPEMKIFNSPGTYDPPQGIKSIKVTVLGGGGGGGLAVAPQQNVRASPGGGAGGSSIKVIPANSLTSPVTTTVGSGGLPENPGETSSFGSFCSATGGEEGVRSLSPASVTNSALGGGIGIGGDINIKGGGAAVAVANTVAGTGGNSIFGGGGRGQLAPRTTEGGDFGGIGAGGGGMNRPPGTPQTNLGGDGIIIIEEFF